MPASTPALAAEQAREADEDRHARGAPPSNRERMVDIAAAISSRDDRAREIRRTRHGDAAQGRSEALLPGRGPGAIVRCRVPLGTEEPGPAMAPGPCVTSPC